MRPEMKLFALEDCLDALIDYRGKTPKKAEAGIPLITAKIVKSGRIEAPNEFIAEADYESWMTRGYPELGDVVLTTEAPLGEVAQIKFLPAAVAQRIVTLRGKRGLLDNDYLLYLLQTEGMQSQLKGRSSGTTVVGIKQSELRKVEVLLPPIAEQEEFASTLRALDDQIDNLRQMNATLEVIASTLFKSWFVDFDGVASKDMRETELGQVPKEWCIGPFVDLVEIISGGTPKTTTTDYWDGDIPWFSVVDAPAAGQVFTLSTSKKITALGLQNCSAKLLPEMTTIISARGTIGKVALTGVPMAMNQSCYALASKVPGGEAYIFFSTLQFVEQLKRIAHGAVFDTITRNSFEQIVTCLPSHEAIVAFGNLAKPLLDRIRTNGEEAATLAVLRDQLLPKLIGGALRIEPVTPDEQRVG